MPASFGVDAIVLLLILFGDASKPRLVQTTDLQFRKPSVKIPRGKQHHSQTPTYYPQLCMQGHRCSQRYMHRTCSQIFLLRLFPELRAWYQSNQNLWLKTQRSVDFQPTRSCCLSVPAVVDAHTASFELSGMEEGLVHPMHKECATQ